MKVIEDLLRRRIGLNVSSLGSSMIERTIRHRLKALGLATTTAYAQTLEKSADEWEELLESVVVTETWFFRDQSPFVTLAQLVRTELLPKLGNCTLRLLSLPCASGEEPFSMAMTLLDAGVPRERFQIHAADLSVRALSQAKAANYGRNSFRGDTGFRARHFTAIGHRYQMNENIRDCVTFYRANLLDLGIATSGLTSPHREPDSETASAVKPATPRAAQLAGRAVQRSATAKLEHHDRGFPALLVEPYDIIFCRNLLIYLERAAQAQALQKLQSLLKPEGVLFVSAAELPVLLNQGFALAGPSEACAVRSHRGNETHPLRSRTQAIEGRRETTAKVAPRNQVGTQPNLNLNPPASDLKTAREFADAGRLSEAAKICETNLAVTGPNAEAYYLLGLIAEGTTNSGLKSNANRERAALAHAPDLELPLAYYRRALYLCPTHHEALLQMSLLLEKQGDSIGAANYRRRARRAAKPGETRG